MKKSRVFCPYCKKEHPVTWLSKKWYCGVAEKAFSKRESKKAKEKHSKWERVS